MGSSIKGQRLVALFLVHEFPNLAFLPLFAKKRHPAIGGKAVRQETNAPAEQRPERPVDPRGGDKIDYV